MHTFEVREAGSERLEEVDGINRAHTSPPWSVPHQPSQGGCTPKVYNNIDGIQIRGDDVDDTPAHAGPTSDVTPGANVCWLFE